jgi:hypothetical protein
MRCLKDTLLSWSQSEIDVGATCLLDGRGSRGLFLFKLPANLERLIIQPLFAIIFPITHHFSTSFNSVGIVAPLERTGTRTKMRSFISCFDSFASQSLFGYGLGNCEYDFIKTIKQRNCLLCGSNTLPYPLQGYALPDELRRNMIQIVG